MKENLCTLIKLQSTSEEYREMFLCGWNTPDAVNTNVVGARDRDCKYFVPKDQVFSKHCAHRDGGTCNCGAARKEELVIDKLANL